MDELPRYGCCSLQCDNGNHTTYGGGLPGGPLNSVSNGTGETAGAAWLGDVIKTKLVPAVCVFGIIGNCLTVVVLAVEQMRSAAGAERKVNVWLQALAVSDLLLCLSLLPHGLMTYGGRLVYSSLSFQLLYQAYGSALINNFMLTSTWLTVAMSFGRYIAVCHPLGLLENVPLLADCTARGGVSDRTRIKAGAIFVLCFLFNLPRFFFVSEMTYDMYESSGTYTFAHSLTNVFSPRFFEYKIDSHRCRSRQN